MSNGEDDDKDGLDDAEIGQMLSHLEEEEEASVESALASVESLHVWLSSHPALRQMPIVEKLSEIGPMILNVLRTLLGFPPRSRPPAAGVAAGENGVE